jgi:hypothetical protein
VRARDEVELSLPPIDPEVCFSVDLAVFSLGLIPTLSTEPADDKETIDTTAATQGDTTAALSEDSHAEEELEAEAVRRHVRVQRDRLGAE